MSSVVDPHPVPRGRHVARAGVVVCGGRSRRMGSDKARLEVAGTTFLRRAVAALGPAVDELLLATGPEPRYADLGIAVVLDRRADVGPLAGLESALEATRAERLFVLAVDMPGVDSALVEALFARGERDDPDALFLESDAGIEPLCGVVHVRVLPAVRAALDAGERRMMAPFERAHAPRNRPSFATVHVRELGVQRAAENVNDPADLARVRSRFAREVAT